MSTVQSFYLFRSHIYSAFNLSCEHYGGDGVNYYLTIFLKVLLLMYNRLSIKYLQFVIMYRVGTYNSTISECASLKSCKFFTVLNYYHMTCSSLNQYHLTIA